MKGAGIKRTGAMEGQGTHGWAFQERKHRGTIEDDDERKNKCLTTK
jgi:hypothetical protein